MFITSSDIVEDMGDLRELSHEFVDGVTDSMMDGVPLISLSTSLTCCIKTVLYNSTYMSCKKWWCTMHVCLKTVYENFNLNFRRDSNVHCL